MVRDGLDKTGGLSLKLSGPAEAQRAGGQRSDERAGPERSTGPEQEERTDSRCSDERAGLERSTGQAQEEKTDSRCSDERAGLERSTSQAQEEKTDSRCSDECAGPERSIGQVQEERTDSQCCDERAGTECCIGQAQEERTVGQHSDEHAGPEGSTGQVQEERTVGQHSDEHAGPEGSTGQVQEERTDSQHSDEHVGPECSIRTDDQEQEERTDGQFSDEHAGPEGSIRTEPLDSLLWRKLDLGEQSETWQQLLKEKLPTHLRPFSSAGEYELVKTTYQQLIHSDYYWGPLSMDEAHRVLTSARPGTFLIRDSCQPHVFFTLSYRSEDTPTSVRVQLQRQMFSLRGSRRSFRSLFALLSFYTSPSGKLSAPYRRQRPESLQRACRRALVRAYGARDLPELCPRVRSFVHAYPHGI